MAFLAASLHCLENFKVRKTPDELQAPGYQWLAKSNRAGCRQHVIRLGLEWSLSRKKLMNGSAVQAVVN